MSAVSERPSETANSARCLLEPKGLLQTNNRTTALNSSLHRSLCGLGMILMAICAQAQAPSDPATVQRGKDLFSANCGFCHGPEAMGTEQAPPLARNRLTSQDQNGEVLEPVIKAGRPGQGMPAFPSLTHEQILEIASYLHVRAREIRGPRMPEERLLVGDAKAGQAYFNGAGKCGTCHSPAGDLKGVASKYSPFVLETTLLTPRPKPLRATVVLASGATVTGEVKYQDEFVVSLVASAGDYESFSRAAVRSVDIQDPLSFHKLQLAKYTDDDIHNLLAYLETLK
jgi:cytochrome c oxidase cbb3-type subunit III